MNDLNQEIENKLKNQGAELIHFVSISHIDEKQNRQLPNAIVFALPLTAAYIKEVSEFNNHKRRNSRRIRIQHLFEMPYTLPRTQTYMKRNVKKNNNAPHSFPLCNRKNASRPPCRSNEKIVLQN